MLYIIMYNCHLEAFCKHFSICIPRLFNYYYVKCISTPCQKRSQVWGSVLEMGSIAKIHAQHLKINGMKYFTLVVSIMSHDIIIYYLCRKKTAK